MSSHFRAFVFAVVGLVVPLSGVASAQGVYVIRSKESGMVLSNFGVGVVQEHFQPGKLSQRWIVTPVPGTQPTQNWITSVASGTQFTAMTVQKGDNKAQVTLTVPARDQANQWWIFEPVDRSAYVLIKPALYSKRAMDVPGHSKLPLEVMQIYNVNKKDNQLWLFEPVQ